MEPTSGDAPSGPQALSPTWTSSAKDLIATALGPSRLWAALGHGIVNEVYWPSTGEPQIRDLGFVVTGPHGWSELKRVARYRIETPAPDVPVPTIVHEGPQGAYRLTLEIAPDPSRDVLLIRHRLKGEGCRLLALLAPRLGPRSDAGEAWAEAGGSGALTATGGGRWLCLVHEPGFSRASAGHVGVSDGWQDLERHGEMRWTYAHAGPSNVALMGECSQAVGVLALGFSDWREGAATLARSSLVAGFDAARGEAVAGWRDWAATITLPQGLPDDLAAQARRSAAVLKAHEDATFPGAVVASLSVPWGSSRDDLGGYHLVWPRDAVNTGLALLACGLVDDARRMLAYLVALQCEDGHWRQNFYPDGRPYWSAVQMDEVGFPVLLAARLREEGAARAEETPIRRMVERAVGYIARHGPLTPQDRWEENAGLNPYTLAVMVAALVAGADWLDGPAREAALALADDWNARIEEWTYAEGSALARAHGQPGTYLRIAPHGDRPPSEQSVEVRNRGGLTVPAEALVSMDFLALVRLGLRAADDPRVRASVAAADAVLAVETPQGRAYHRYPEDGYGEHADGAPFDGQGIGRGWPLLTGERGHYALQAGEDALPHLRAMARMTGPGGMIPEQVWDAEPIPERALAPGLPSGSAMPLVWAHSEFLKLALAMAGRRPVELLGSVERRCRSARPPMVRHWRTAVPLRRVAPGATLVVEDLRPFTLHLSLDGWRSVEDRAAEPRPFGLWGAALGPLERGAIVFTRRHEDGWEGRDHRVEVAPEG